MAAFQGAVLSELDCEGNTEVIDTQRSALHWEVSVLAVGGTHVGLSVSQTAPGSLGI